MGKGPFLAFGGAVAGAWVAVAARGAGPGPNRPEPVRIDVSCAALAGEARAAFETRVKVDLALRAPEGGDLVVRCDGSAARLIWRSSAHPESPSETSIALPAQGLVDALLEAVSRLGGSSTEPAFAPSVPSGPVAVAASAAPAPAASATASVASGAPGGVSSAPSAAPVNRPRPSPRVDTSWNSPTGDGDAPFEDAAFETREERRARLNRRKLGAALLAGGNVRSSFVGDSPFMLGPTVGFAVYGSPLGRFMLASAATVALGPARVDGVAAQLWEIGLSADWFLDAEHNWLVGMTGFAGSLSADAQGGPIVSGDGSKVFGGGAIRAGCLVSGSPLRLFFAPELRFTLAPVSVNLGDTQLFGTGEVAAGITVAGLLPVIGPGEGP